jgi:hypothetical protein
MASPQARRTDGAEWSRIFAISQTSSGLTSQPTWSGRSPLASVVFQDKYNLGLGVDRIVAIINTA